VGEEVRRVDGAHEGISVRVVVPLAHRREALGQPPRAHHHGARARMELVHRGAQGVCVDRAGEQPRGDLDAPRAADVVQQPGEVRRVAVELNPPREPPRDARDAGRVREHALDELVKARDLEERRAVHRHEQKVSQREGAEAHRRLPHRGDRAAAGVEGAVGHAEQLRRERGVGLGEAHHGVEVHVGVARHAEDLRGVARQHGEVHGAALHLGGEAGGDFVGVHTLDTRTPGAREAWAQTRTRTRSRPSRLAA
jgi:hypothetical protein